MHRLDTSVVLLLLSISLIPIHVCTAFSQDDADDSAILNQLFLNVYVDEGGRALINGYIDDPGSLAFLNSSEYTFEDDGRQLYAITSALTSKSRDNWTASFESEGDYNEYHVIFYLPANAKLSRVDCSQGLGYLVSVANESIIAEVQGNDVKDPAINIEYLIPIDEASKAEAGIVTSTDVGPPYKTIALVVLLAIGSGILIFFLKSRFIFEKLAGRIDRPHERTMDSGKLKAPAISENSAADSMAVVLNQEIESSQKKSEAIKMSDPDENREAGIKQTNAILAIMDTLTDKEKAIVKALLARGGTMTQTELRYETDISKSSLSGILTSMEKRKLVIKEEKGRTNVIELSNRFLNTQERS
jgi:DNA-binding MarR family transcriptional regulator